MRELRRVLAVLRAPHHAAQPHPQPSLADLGELVGRYRAAGLPVRLEVAGQSQPFPVGLDGSVYGMDRVVAQHGCPSRSDHQVHETLGALTAKTGEEAATHQEIRVTLSPAAARRERTDEELIEHFRDGSEDAFAILHDRHRPALLRFVRRTLPASVRHDAEDVLQDAFVLAYRALKADAREIRFRPWLFRIARNRCVDEWRRRAPEQLDLHDEIGGADDPVVDVDTRERLTMLVADIGRLPRHQRAAVVLRELGGFSYDAIAAELGVTVPAVKSLLVRARRSLHGAHDGRVTPCGQIRAELLHRRDNGLRASERTRQHVRICSACAAFRATLRARRM